MGGDSFRCVGYLPRHSTCVTSALPRPTWRSETRDLDLSLGPGLNLHYRVTVVGGGWGRIQHHRTWPAGEAQARTRIMEGRSATPGHCLTRIAGRGWKWP